MEIRREEVLIPLVTVHGVITTVILLGVLPIHLVTRRIETIMAVRIGAVLTALGTQLFVEIMVVPSEVALIHLAIQLGVTTMETQHAVQRIALATLLVDSLPSKAMHGKLKLPLRMRRTSCASSVRFWSDFPCRHKLLKVSYQVDNTP